MHWHSMHPGSVVLLVLCIQKKTKPKTKTKPPVYFATIIAELHENEYHSVLMCAIMTAFFSFRHVVFSFPIFNRSLI